MHLMYVMHRALQEQYPQLQDALPIQTRGKRKGTLPKVHVQFLNAPVFQELLFPAFLAYMPGSRLIYNDWDVSGTAMRKPNGVVLCAVPVMALRNKSDMLWHAMVRYGTVCYAHPRARRLTIHACD